MNLASILRSEELKSINFIRVQKVIDKYIHSFKMERNSASKYNERLNLLPTSQEGR